MNRYISAEVAGICGVMAGVFGFVTLCLSEWYHEGVILPRGSAINATEVACAGVPAAVFLLLCITFAVVSWRYKSRERHGL